ncbi:serine O-acetyltransferase EpsC [Desulfoferrobacter suflitae]|uniref:serine O-acetyltransferase EpsC n=1 Tax=Desulfoferrobacter suflitae TaxID=2865782 RepID=UPI00216407CF|nr:serine O-acetyltransferase EpsC [Desulfoferrobacter suflitae]MCK8602056.1 serine acetyltransferase [Desulfoferrobacter suflitae]
MNATSQRDQCKTEMTTRRKYREELPRIVDQLVRSCGDGQCFDHVGPEPIPSREFVIDVIHRVCLILYPGYFIRNRLDQVNLSFYLGQEVTSLFETLSEQITLAIRHDCMRHNQPCVQCEERGQALAIEFLQELPAMRAALAKDVRAGFEGDPAAKSYDEIIFSYPGLFAITVYRIAHQLHIRSVPLLPRIMSEFAHSSTGIDIHPGAQIGDSFFIDHGTGVVIGETTRIGNRVRIYQGVTLGALSLPKDAGERLRHKRRHPTIEDDVIIYSGATVLGGDTVIGARSVIGGNVWITASVPPDTRVLSKKPELVYK